MIYTNQCNYLAIQLLEKMGIFDPTQAQIDDIENLLMNCSLNEKEFICLYWTACGKSIQETTKLMNINSAEVMMHCEEVTRKLNSPNLAQMIFEGVVGQ